MKAHICLVALLTLSVAQAGCEFGRRYVNKPWGAGTYIPAAVCAAIGAGVGVVIQDQTAATASATIQNPDGTVSHVSQSGSNDLWKGALIGAPIGAVVCGLAGHYFLDHEPVTPTVVPPPPSPTPSPSPMPTETPMPLPPPSSKRLVLRGVHFDFNRSDIRPDSRPVLDEAAAILRQNPNVHIEVEGYTDSIGSAAYNQRLSVRRADAVFRYLVNHGVTPERMQVAGYGETRPVANNGTASGRAQNRRVELHVLPPQTPAAH